MHQEQPLQPLPAQKAFRVWIEDLSPLIDGGSFPIKRTVGEEVEVSAFVFADGHDEVKACLCYRPVTGEWQETAMTRREGDLWTADFTVDSLGAWQYTVKGWIDHFASWQDGLRKKFAAGQQVTSELLEGATMIAAAAGRAPSPDCEWLMALAASLQSDGPQTALVALATAPETGAMMNRYPDRAREAVFEPTLAVSVEPKLAGCGAWYEIFPRSVTDTPGKSGTFSALAAKLPEIARLGFDVLYLPPIHPIGRTNRKGRNNQLQATPEDPGSPWAIGSHEGGHKAVHPDLGTLADFDRLLAAAKAHGLELALDIAFQCSPDHPYVREHPEWFRHRPDGTIKYAENPPKRYEDIYPFDFDCREWQSLWQELQSVVLFWIERGVRIFRVDNPHTKPLRFWQWLIAEVRRDYPDTVFLSEAFTRPRVKYALAKAGFSQSYTYFTWRNTRQQLIDYLQELLNTEVREYFRPNFFANTPDILPEYLQFGGRPAFMSRLVLAATLSACYGIYSGYELLENEALPGSEEYLNSEKFEIKPRDWGKPGNLRPLIAKINTIRRDNPALATNRHLAFHWTDNEQLLLYSKRTDDGTNIILTAVNLDPHHLQEGWLDVDLAEFGIAENEIFQVHELIGDGRFLWQGRRNFVRLDPASCPAQIFRIRRRLRTEHDFDYFM